MNQDEDAEGFQRLHEAYQQAMKLAKQRKLHQAQVSEVDSNDKSHEVTYQVTFDLNDQISKGYFHLSKLPLPSDVSTYN